MRSPAFRRQLLGLAVAACFAGAASGNPTGPAVAGGMASFATSGKTLTVTNTPGAIINWQAFSIRPDEVTRFVQSGAASAVLNRVTGAEHSAILGQLLSNGRVFLINPNGVTVGAGARIDTAGFVASSLNLSDADFLAGRYRFADPGNAGKVANAGTIAAHSGGPVYLIAPTVENHGVITAPNGEITLAAGKTVELVSAGSPHLRVEVQAGGEALNVGRLIAESGRVGLYGAAIRNPGTISADSASVNAAGNVVLKASREVTLDATGVVSANGPQAGTVHAQAEQGTLLVGGRVEAKGAVGAGGEVKLLGTQVGLTGAAAVDASGASGGGRVLVGGDYQGANPDVQNARATHVGAEAALRADAIDSGDGGKVIVWADGATRFQGSVSARGGARAGDGGFVEVSGKDYLEFTGAPDTRAPKGRDGMLLLDPTNVTISSAPTGNGTCPPAGPCFTLTGNPATANLDVADLVNALANTNVTVNTASTGPSAGDITVQNAVSYGGGAARTLTLTANRNIAIDAPIATTGGSLAVTMTAAGTGTVAVNQAITTRGGAVTATGPGGVTSTVAGAIDTTGGNNQNGGAVTINSSAGSVNLAGAVTASGGTRVGAGTGRAGGAVTMNGTSTTVAAITTRGTNAVGANNAGGNGGAVALNATGAGGTLLVNGAIDTRGGDSAGTGNTGSGGGVTLRAGNAGTVTTATGATIDTTGGRGQTGGGVTVSGTAAANTLASVNLQGAIAMNGGAAAGVGKNAGTLSITQVEAVTLAAPVSARGSNAATGNNVGGNGGQVLLDARDLAATAATLPSMQVAAAIDTRGGDSLGTGNTGTGGLVRLRATAGGSVASTAAGTITTTGGRGQGGGGVTVTGLAAADTITSVALQGAITTDGGAGTLAGAAGKTAGAISVTQAEAVTLGAISARGSNSTSGTAAGAAGGSGGSVSVTVRDSAATPAAPAVALTGTIDTRGGDSTGTTNGGSGGAVALRSSAGGTVTSTAAATINTSGGRGQTGGAASVSSTPAADTLASINVAGAITTSGGQGSTNAVGLNAGTVTLSNATSTTLGGITARGGTSGGANAVGGNGGAVSIAARNGTPSIQLNGAIDTRGGDSAGTGNTGNGGAVTVATGTANGSIGSTAAATITTSGGRGQNGANVSVTTTGTGTISLQGAVTSSGGAAATGAGKNAGTVTIGSATTTATQVAAITATGSSAAAGAGGNGGAVVVRGTTGVTLAGNIATTGGTGVAAGGAGAGVAVTGPTTLAANVAVNSSGGAGTPAGAGGAVSFGATSTIDSDGTARSLTIASGTAAVTLGAAAGTASALASTSVTGGAVNLRGVRTTGQQGYAGTGVTLNGTLQSTTAGTMTVTGPVALAGASAVRTAGGAGDNVSFPGTINGAQALTIDAGNAGTVAFGGGIGQTTALASLGVTAASVTLPATRTGTLAVTTGGGAIGQTGAVVATGTATLNAGAGNVILTNAANDFGGAVGVTAANADLRDANALALGASTLSGNLGLTAGGAITQTGAVVAPGTTTIAAGASNVTLGHTANDLGTVSVTSGGNVSLVDANALTVGTSSVATLSARTLAGDLTLGGNVAATGAGDAIVLAAAGNFLNPGSRTVAPGTGRWLIYSASPSTTTLGGLAPVFKRYNCTFAGGCLTPGTTVPGAGDGILYSVAPTVNVAANAVAIEYGSSPAALSYTSSGFIDGDTAASALAGTLARTPGGLSTSGNEVAGATAITPGTVASPLGYQINYTGASYTITPKALTAGLTGTATKVYDATTAATLAPANYTLSGAIAGDVVTLNNPVAGAYDTPNVGAGKTVGVGGLALAGADAGNYAVNATATGTIGTITPATLTYVANPASRDYGDPGPALSGTVSGFQGADTLPTATTGTLEFTTPANATSGVGSYAINGSGLAADNGNYVFVQAPGNATALTVAPRPITLTAGSAARAYGDANPVPAPLYAVGGKGMANAENAQTLFGLTVASGAAANTPVGSYAAGPNAYNIAGAATGVNGNYDITAIGPGTLTIDQRPITVTADPGQSKIYGEANPAAYAYSLTAGSLVAGDALAGATSRVAGENVGNYAIQQGTLTAGGNYALSFVSNDFAITVRPITIAANAGQGKVYGAADPALTYAVAAGAATTGPAIVAGDSLVGALARAPGENAGPYGINQGTLAPNVPANYAVTFVPNTFAIAPAPLTVTANAQTKVYGTADPSLTYAAAGFQFADTPATVLSGGLVRAPGETVAGGPYAITQGTLTSNPNYTVSFTGNDLTITPAALTIAANNAARPYGDPNPALTATFTGLANGDTAAAIPGVVVATTAAQASNVGLYPIGVTSGTNSNYTIAYVNGRFSVMPAPLTITANNAARPFGQPNPPFTYTSSGFKLGQRVADLDGSLVLSSSATPASPFGAYPITPGGVSATNYAITFVDGTLAVGAAAPAADHSLVTATSRSQGGVRLAATPGQTVVVEQCRLAVQSGGGGPLATAQAALAAGAAAGRPMDAPFCEPPGRP